MLSLKPMKGLFVGMYPNEVNKYRNVFFQNLIYAMADIGIECTVISPVPITKYGISVTRIPFCKDEITPKGNKVHVYYPRYISASSKDIFGFNTEKLSEYFFEYSAIKVARKLNDEFDFVYGHFVLYGGLAAIKIGRILDIPSYFAYGECDFYSEVGRTYGIPKNREIQGLKGIVSVSTKNTNELKKLGFVDTVPIITEPNAIDLSLFYKRDKIECRKKLGLDPDKFIVGFVGGFIERKGDKRLLRAVEALDDVYVAFAGRGQNPPTGDRVLFCNALEHEDIPILLNSVDAFVLPTLAEGSCNAIVEAMACGLPIISSDLPFNDDALDENNSIRVNPNSVEEISNAIISLKNDLKKRTKMGIAACKTAQRFGIFERASRIKNFILKTK